MTDAEAGAELLCRSITALCRADHGDDPARIAAWTANKTPDAWRLWCAQPSSVLLVAERAGVILGVAMMAEDGAILLNYVLPEARFAGVSTDLMSALEAEALRRGLVACHLHSTRTGEAFYLARGYRPAPGGGDRAMVKVLAGAFAQ
jgi:GNAT superfamily N-acetyltransferase